MEFLCHGKKCTHKEKQQRARTKADTNEYSQMHISIYSLYTIEKSGTPSHKSKGVMTIKWFFFPELFSFHGVGQNNEVIQPRATTSSK